MSWKELMVTALIAALLIFWFSFWGPTEVSAPAPRGQGYEQRGESGLVVSGSGAEIVTVATQNAQGRMQNDVSAERPAPEENNSDLSTQHSELTGYWYGVGAVILGQVVILILGRNDDGKTE